MARVPLSGTDCSVEQKLAMLAVGLEHTSDATPRGSRVANGDDLRMIFVIGFLLKMLTVRMGQSGRSAGKSENG
jgi:hypothetical protein